LTYLGHVTSSMTTENSTTTETQRLCGSTEHIKVVAPLWSLVALLWSVVVRCGPWKSVVAPL